MTDREHEAVKAELDESQMLYLSILLDHGCKFVFRTELPRGGWAEPKPYVMMKDRAGTLFLERIPDSHA